MKKLFETIDKVDEAPHGFRRLKLGLLSILMIVAMLSLFLTPPAQAQVTANNIGSFTNASVTCPSNSTVTVNGPPILLSKGKGITISSYSTAAAAGTSNTTYYFNVRMDGTNWTTNWTGLSGTITQSGTNPVRGMFRFTADQLDGCDAIRWWKAVTLQTNDVTITQIFSSIPN